MTLREALRWSLQRMSASDLLRIAAARMTEEEREELRDQIADTVASPYCLTTGKAIPKAAEAILTALLPAVQEEGR